MGIGEKKNIANRVSQLILYLCNNLLSVTVFDNKLYNIFL